MPQSITKEQIEVLKQQNILLHLVDIRSSTEFEKLHIPGAINMPVETIEANTEQFAKDDMIVCVCNKGHERSQNATDVFTNEGFLKVYYLAGGTLGWLQA
jgi:rhodanese-related sulfurtransferase